MRSAIIAAWFPEESSGGKAMVKVVVSSDAQGVLHCSFLFEGLHVSLVVYDRFVLILFYYLVVDLLEYFFSIVVIMMFSLVF